VLPDDVPVMAGNDSYEYEFSHWEGYTEGMVLTGDVDFVAYIVVQVRLYKILFKYRNKTIGRYDLPYGTVIDYDASTKPWPYPTEDDQNYAYRWNDWTPDYRVTGDFTFTLDSYEQYDHVVTWQIDKTNSLTTYYRQDDLLALPAPPAKEGNEFLGWQGYTADIHVTEDMTVRAIWAHYTVSFVLDDSVASLVEDASLGSVEAASVDAIRYPTPPEIEGYVFAEWSGCPETLIEEVTLTAVYKRGYTVCFYDEQGELIVPPAKVAEGTAAIPPEPPIKEGDAQYHYDFDGWRTEDGDYLDVRNDMALYAEYVAVVNRYTYTLHLANGEADVIDTVDYGTEIVPPAPSKAPTVDTTYTFAGWDADGDGEADYIENAVCIVADCELWALYTQAVRLYSVAYSDGGVTLGEYRLPYGAVIDYDGQNRPHPYPTEDSQPYAYRWSGLTPAYEVTEDVVFALERTAQYDYVVTWQIDETDSLITYYCRDDLLALPADPMREAYIFVEWQGYEAGMTVTQDMTLVAVWAQS
jgi:hypothetical protein